MAKIWLLATGEYSDYRIIGAYSSQEKAKHASEIINGTYVENALTVNELPASRAGLYWYRVVMTRSGDSTCALADSPGTCRFIDNYWGLNYGRVYEMYVEARDIKHAVKIANEKRAQLIANNEWPAEV